MPAPRAAKAPKPAAPAATAPAQPTPPAPVAPVAPSSPDQDLFKLAKGLYQDQLYENAADQFRRYLQEFPQGKSREEAGLLLGRSRFQLKDYPAALSALSAELPKAKTLRDQILFLLGESAYLLHQDDRSARAFRQLLDSYPKYPDADQARRRLAQISYRQGNKNLALGAYTKALEFYQQAPSPPADLAPLILYKTGECLVRLGRLDEAEAALKKAEAALATSDPATAALVSFRRAQLLEEAGRSEEAVRAFQDFLKASPRHSLAPAAHRAIAQADADKGDFKAAVSYLRDQGPAKVIEKAAQDFDSAREHFLLGEYADAEKILKGLIQAKPAAPTARLLALSYRLLARVYLEQEKVADAAKLLSEWSQADPARVDDAMRAFMAELFFQSNQLEAAQAQLQAIGPNAPAAVSDQADFLRAETEFKRGELPAAETDLAAYLAQHPAGQHVAEAWLRLGEVKSLRGDDAGAVAVLRKATPAGASPELLIRGYGLLAESYRKQGLVDSALEASESQKKLLAQVPTAEEQALRRQAELYYRKGDYAKGVELYAELAGQGQTARLQDYRWRQGFGLYRLGKKAEAEAVWKGLAAAGETSVANLAQFWLAQIQADNNDWDGATKTLQAIVTDDPEFNVAMLWQIGRLREAAKDYAGARQAYDQIERNFPDALVDTTGHKLLLALVSEDYQTYMQLIAPLVAGESASFAEADLLAQARAAAAAQDEAELARSSRALRLVAVDEASVEEAALLKAKLLLLKGRREQGLKLMEQILDENPGTPFADQIALELGEELFQRANYDLALARFQGLEPLQQSPEQNSRILFMKGFCQDKVGHTQDMIATYSKLIAAYPSTTTFLGERVQVGVSLKLAEQYDLAIKAFEQALKTETDRGALAEAQYWMGECFQSKGDDRRAITEYMKVTYLYPDQGIWATSAKYQAATILERLGQYQEAVRLYEMVLKESKGDPKREAFARQKLEAAKRKAESSQ